MASQTLAPDTPALPGERRAFLRLALLMAGTVAVNNLGDTFSGENLDFLYKDRLHLTAGGWRVWSSCWRSPTTCGP